MNYYKLLKIGQRFGRGQNEQDEWTEGNFQQKEVIFKQEAKATLEINKTKNKMNWLKEFENMKFISDGSSHQ